MPQPFTVKLFRDKNEDKRYSKAPSDTLGERKEAYMHPKSAEEVFVRMPDSLSDAKMVNKAALDCPDAPLGRHKVGETFPKSAGCTLEEQKRPKVLPKGFGASLKCIEPKKNISQLKRMDKTDRLRILRILSALPYHLSSNSGLPFQKRDINGKSTRQRE